jgi:hypothetical protein
MSGSSPRLDGGVTALVARVRIGNAQGLVIEENVEYNLWSNVLSKYTADKEVYANDISNYTRNSSRLDNSTQSGSRRLNVDKDQLLSFGSHSRRVMMELKNLSIFSKIKYFPLFLFRSALRIEIEFEDPRLAFYEDSLKVLGSVKQNQLCLTPILGGVHAQAPDWTSCEKTVIWSSEMAGFGTYSASEHGVLIDNDYRTLPLHIAHTFECVGYDGSGAGGEQDITTFSATNLDLEEKVNFVAPRVFTKDTEILALTNADQARVPSVGDYILLYRADNSFVFSGVVKAIAGSDVSIDHLSTFPNAEASYQIGYYKRSKKSVSVPAQVKVFDLGATTVTVHRTSVDAYDDADSKNIDDHPINIVKTESGKDFHQIIGEINTRIAFNYVDWHLANGYLQAPSMFVFGDYRQYQIASHVTVEVMNGESYVYEITKADITPYWANFYLRPTKSQAWFSTALHDVNTSLGHVGNAYTSPFEWYRKQNEDYDAVASPFSKRNGYRAGYYKADLQVSSVTFSYDPYGRYENSVAVSSGGVLSTTSVKKTWSYTIENCEMLMDFVKPSSDVMVQYINQYNSDSGIPYTFNRIFYHTKAIDNGNSNAPVQISLPFSVRSLKGILVAITDNLSTYSGSDSTVYKFPSLSSFQMRGLSEAQLVVGAQQFPAYQLRFNRDFFQSEHFPELEVLFNSHFASSNPRVEPMELVKLQKNYGEYGLHGMNVSSSSTAHLTDHDKNDPHSYWDTDGFLLGFSTVKVDGDFASGIDTTAAGSVTLNLHFDTHALPVKRLIHVFGIADSVFTLQKDASLVRY